MNEKLYRRNPAQNIEYGNVLNETANMTYELLLELILQDHNGLIRRSAISKKKISELRRIYPSLSNHTLDILTLQNHDMITLLLSRYALLEQPNIHQFICNQASEYHYLHLKDELTNRIEQSEARYSVISEIFPYFSQLLPVDLDA